MYELAFLWVSKFRNIENQGFNFSSRFIIKYNKDSSNIEISENENYIEDLFGANIVNVTGIIGQNGSGKTNLLELINYALIDGNTKIAAPFFFYLLREKFFGSFYQIQKPSSNFPIEYQSYTKDKQNEELIFFSNSFDERRSNFDKSVHDLSTNRLYQNDHGDSVLRNYKKSIENQLEFIKSDEFNFLTSIENEVNPNINFNLKPKYVQLISPTWSNILLRAGNFDKKIARIIETKFSKLKDFCYSFRKKITDNKSERAILYYTAFLLYIDFVINEFTPSRQIKLTSKTLRRKNLDWQDYSTDKESIRLLKDELNMLNLDKLNNARINEVHEIITNEVSKYIDKQFPHSFEKFKFLYELGQFEYIKIEKFSEGTYSNRKIQFQTEFNDEIQNFIKKYLQATASQNLSYSIEWGGISSGHKAFLNLFSRFYSIKNNIKSNNLIICIDEGDLYFHPKWQAEYLYKLIIFVKKIFIDKSIQLILTTHSPFLVSDLPKSNLIFLGKSIIDKFQVIENKKIDGETFGGNIGELYINAFFMEGSLISHFAYTKIVELINSIKQEKIMGKEISDNNKKLLAQIGEVLLKSKIEELIIDKN